METLQSELRATIARRIQSAPRHELVSIVGAICAHEDVTDLVLAKRPAPASGSRFEVVGETVRDHDTGLTWTRGNVSTERLDWQKAKDACESLTLAGGGWRMPTIKELLTLIDYERSEPAIDTSAFKCDSAWYWSVTNYKPIEGYAWCVYFNGGFACGNGRGSNGFVRAVRGGQF